MRENEIKQIKGKKVEAWIGLVLLILPLIAVVALFLMWFGIVDLLDWDWLSRFVNLKNVVYNSGAWDVDNSSVGTFLSISAIAGAYLLKGNTQYLFVKTKKIETENKGE